jgi:hypothetical protein
MTPFIKRDGFSAYLRSIKNPPLRFYQIQIVENKKILNFQANQPVFKSTDYIYEINLTNI